MCTAYVTYVRSNRSISFATTLSLLLADLPRFAVLAGELNETSLTCTVCIIRTSRPSSHHCLAIAAACSNTIDYHRPSTSIAAFRFWQLIRFLAFGKLSSPIGNPKFGFARGSLLARHLINEVPRCGARKVALQAKLPIKAPRFARRTARHSVASLLRSSLSAFGLTVALQAKLP